MKTEFNRNYPEQLKNKALLITGGTGAFDHTVLNHFISSDIKEIRIFSRNEKKQDAMRHKLQGGYPEYFSKVDFYIGDVRDTNSLMDAMPGVDYIFHVAALKKAPKVVKIIQSYTGIIDKMIWRRS